MCLCHFVDDVKVSGKITYNGHGLDEFVPQRTSAYVSQQDWHVAEMTVRETLEFAGRCQGVGFKYGNLPRIFLKEDGLQIFLSSNIWLKLLRQICCWSLQGGRRKPG